MKLLSKKPVKGKRDDARYDLVCGVFFLTLLVQLLCVRWSPSSPQDEALFQAAGGLWRTGTPSLTGTPQAAELAQEIVAARQRMEDSELGFLWQDPGGLSVALPKAPAGAVLALVPAHVLGSRLQRLMPAVEQVHSTRTGGDSGELFAHLLAALLGPLAGAIACAALAAGALALGARRPMAALAGFSVGLGSVLGMSSGWPEPALLASATLSCGWATLLHLTDRVAAGRMVGRSRLWAVGCALGLTLLLDLRAWPFVLMVLAFGEAGLRRARGGAFPFGQISALLAVMGPSLVALGWGILGSGSWALASQRHWHGGGGPNLLDAPPVEWLRASAVAWIYAPCLLFALLGAGRLLLGADRLVGALSLLALVATVPLLWDRNAHGPVMLLPLLVFVGPAMGVGLEFCAGLRLGPMPLGLVLVIGLSCFGIVTQTGAVLVDTQLVQTLDSGASATGSADAFRDGPRAGVHWRILRRQYAVEDGRFPLTEIYGHGDPAQSVQILEERSPQGRLMDHLALSRLQDDLEQPLFSTFATLILALLAGSAVLVLWRGLDPSRWP